MAKQAAKDIDPDVAMVLKTMGNYLAAKRKSLGFRQVDVAECMNMTETTVVRVEKGGGQIRLVTFLTYLKELGELSVFADVFTKMDAGTRQRVRPVSSEPTDPSTPLSASEFLARVQRDPNLEAMVTPRAAVSLARAGYAVRYGQHESVDVIYATSMDVARNSEHVYQGSDGERIGGVAKLRLVLAESKLSAKQLTVVRLEHASLQGRLNARFQAAKTPVFIEEILTIPDGQHVLTFLKDGREVSSQFLYDAVLNELSEGA